MNGLLILSKPRGLTSHDVVARARWLTGESSIGHLGTLDPMATGVLPLLLGRFTRLAQFYGSLEKHYTGSIRFGFATDTYDAEGEPVGERQHPVLTLEQVRAAASAFQGDTDQMPPPFSAKKINGRPAHRLARAGLQPKLRTARITIHAFVIESVTEEQAQFRMSVSAGGYVRSIAHELGQKLGCGAHLASLCRVAAGPFLLEQALTLEQLAEAASRGEIAASMPHPRALLPHLPAVTADDVTVARLRNGAAVCLPEYSAAPLVKIFAGQHTLVAVGRRVAGVLFQPVVVLG